MTDDFRHVRKLDWSQYHPFDHWPFTSRCHKFYGGGWHHLKTAWQYRRRDELVTKFVDPFWKLINCRRGKHRWQIGAWVNGQTAVYHAYCWACDTDRLATPEEKKKFGPIPFFDHDTKNVGMDGAPEW